MRRLAAFEGHILPTLNLLDHYETQVGRDEDVRLEALRIVEQTADPKSLGQFLDRALRDFPDSDILQLQLARWFMATEDLNAAEQELNALLERRPDWGLVHFELAELVTRKAARPTHSPIYARPWPATMSRWNARSGSCWATDCSPKKTRSLRSPTTPVGRHDVPPRRRARGGGIGLRLGLPTQSA